MMKINMEYGRKKTAIKTITTFQFPGLGGAHTKCCGVNPILGRSYWFHYDSLEDLNENIFQ